MLKLEPEQLVYVILPVRLIDKSIISLSSMQTISKKYYDETLNIKTKTKNKSHYYLRAEHYKDKFCIENDLLLSQIK